MVTVAGEHFVTILERLGKWVMENKAVAPLLATSRITKD